MIRCFMTTPSPKANQRQRNFGRSFQDETSSDINFNVEGTPRVLSQSSKTTREEWQRMCAGYSASDVRPNGQHRLEIYTDLTRERRFRIRPRDTLRLAYFPWCRATKPHSTCFPARSSLKRCFANVHRDVRRLEYSSFREIIV